VNLIVTGPLLREYISKTGGKQAIADFVAASAKTFTIHHLPTAASAIFSPPSLNT
jgi:hypothetical protein